jgi:hypothetical protein
MPFKVLALSDIHGKKSHLISILKRFNASPPDLVLACGDITHFAITADELRSVLDVFQQSGFMYGYVLGNCDPPELRGGIDGMGRCLDANCLSVAGLDIIGAGGSTWTPFGTPFEIGEGDILERLEKGESRCHPTGEGRLVIVAHNPPRGEIIDKTREGIHVGSPRLLAYILQKKPLLVITGHIHEAIGTELIGETTVVNPGPVLRGCYAVIEIEDGRQMRVNHGSL